MLDVNRSPDGLVVIAAPYRDFDSGATHVAVAFVRDLTRMAEGIDWLADNTNRRIPIVIDSASPASVAMSRLNAMKKKVIPTHSVEMCRACSGFTDDVKAGLLTHADCPNQDLDAAVDGARRRPVGDAGG